MIQASIHIHGKPEWDIQTNEDDSFSPDVLRKRGNELQKHLHEVADIMQKLIAQGWDYELCLYDLNFGKDITKEQAEKELKELGIDPEVMQLWECETEGEWCEVATT